MEHETRDEFDSLRYVPLYFILHFLSMSNTMFHISFMRDSSESRSENPQANRAALLF